MEQTEILSNLTIIIPIHEFIGEADLKFFNSAIESIKTNKKYLPSEVLIVFTKEDFEKYGIDKKVLEGLNVSFLHNKSTKTDFCSQINFAVEKVTTEYFSIMEFDDEYGDIAFQSFKEYSDAYTNVSIFLTNTIETTSNDKFIKFSNCELMSRGAIPEGKLGLLNHQTMQMMTALVLSGSYIKKVDFLQFGGLKPSMKVSFIYEYLLRATYNEQIVFLIPKLSYLHRNGREGSYLDIIKKSNITKEEVTFWYDNAKKEFYFTRDRELSYRKEVEPAQ